MNIVIAGAGEVGTHLAKMLSNEDHNIVLVDQDETRLKRVETYADLMSMQGNPTSIKDLKEANMKNCDLFIGVTPYESENIVACMLAKDLGASKTVARIDNMGYFLDGNQERFKKMGIDSMIYPEVLAAEEIVQSLRMPGIRQLYEIADGELLLAGIKVRKKAPIIGLPLEHLNAKVDNYRVLAITRSAETIIPTGNDMIKDGDIVYFICLKSQLSYVKERAGKENFDIQNVMIMGGSRIGMKTAQIAPNFYNIKIIEQNKERSYKVVSKLDRALVINGDGRDLDLLKDEGIQQMDAFIALTGNSETNILSCLLAKRLGVKKTVAEVENMDFIELAENFNIGTVINKKRLAASHIYQHTLKANISTMKCLTASDAEVIELTAKSGAKITRAELKKSKIPKDINIGAIIRGSQIQIAHGDMQILAGDKVIVYCLPSGIRKVEKLFN